MSQPIGMLRYADPHGVILGVEASQVIRISQEKSPVSGNILRVIHLKNAESVTALDSFKILETRHAMLVAMARGDEKTARTCLNLLVGLSQAGEANPGVRSD